MAIDPRLSLIPGAAQPARTQGAIEGFQNALLSLQGQDPATLQRERSMLSNQLLQAQTQERNQLNRIRSLAVFAGDVQGDLQRGDLQGIREKTAARIDQLRQQGSIPDDSEELLRLIDNPNLTDEQKLREIQSLSGEALANAQRFGVIQAPSGGERFSATTVNLPGGLTVQTTTEGRKFVTDAQGNQLQGEAAVDAIAAAEEREIRNQQRRAEARAVGTAEGQAETAETVARTKAGIARAVKLAESEAKERGEVLTDFDRAQAALPGLEKVVAELRELSNVATSTVGGKIFDTAAKELGFGATKGATARSKYVAIVRNQILPLLKQTFGAAFTASEGEALMATLGDPDSSPAQKQAELDAFIEQKRSQVQELGGRLGQGLVSPDQSGVAPINVGGATPFVQQGAPTRSDPVVPPQVSGSGGFRILSVE